jgi:hypothetical protein
MAKKSGRGGKKDPLGKLLLTSGNPNPAILAGGAGVVAVGLVLAVVALFTTPLALLGTAFLVLAGGLGVWVGLTGQARVFEVRAKGVRSVVRGEAAEIRWEDVKKVVVQKSLRGKNRTVMRVTNLNDGTQEYRGEMVMYEFTVTGGGEKIVFSCGGPNTRVHPRTLLGRFEEFARGKVTVHEPDDEYYFDD